MNQYVIAYTSLKSIATQLKLSYNYAIGINFYTIFLVDSINQNTYICSLSTEDPKDPNYQDFQQNILPLPTTQKYIMINDGIALIVAGVTSVAPGNQA